jgi:hypothetical protein
VELLAPKCFRLYRLLGGSVLTEAAFRAKVRRELVTGERI